MVQGAWEGITFDRYYHGRAPWMTVPPIDSHKVHRTDLMLNQMNRPDPMAPLLAAITSALENGKNIWVVGIFSVVSSDQLPPPPPPPPNLPTKWYLGPYLGYWSAQLTAHLASQAREVRPIEIKVEGPVNIFEHLPLMRFSGYRPPADTPAAQ